MIEALSGLETDAFKGASLDEIEATLERAYRYRQTHAAEFFTPYEKQKEFIALGALAAERLLTAGNQVGKSATGGYEAYAHLTGRYPEWWEGRRWNRPTHGWIAGESNDTNKEVSQTILCGPAGIDELFGTGLIPAELFAAKPTLIRGAADCYDTLFVYHETNGIRDGISTAKFKSYEQGRKKFQGKTLDWLWWDEEPAIDIYTEGSARFSATGGMSWLTFTPLEGNTEVIQRFKQGHAARRMLRMSVYDAGHMTEEKIQALRDKYPEYTWAARIDGFPQLGEGGIFTTPEKNLTFSMDKIIPPHWPLLWGIDFGISHPFAAVLVAWDRDEDKLYIIGTYRASDATPLVHAEMLKRICATAPVAWPHDGHRRELGSGHAISKQYKSQGLLMLPTHAHFSDGSYSTEAAVLEMQQREQDGRLLIREDLADYLDERRMYHRKDGQIVKLDDDLISAMQKVIMQKRSAKVVDRHAVAWRTPYRNRPQRGEHLNPWTGRPN